MISGASTTARALRRIQRDLDELKRLPEDGIGISRVSSEDQFLYVVNIKIMDGIYEGVIVQMEMTVPQTFPVSAPTMLIYPNQSFGPDFHHHIYEGPKGYKRFCVDILGNAIMSTSSEKSGWSPAYTFKTLFMQIQNFLADPDGKIADPLNIKKMKEQMKSYTRTFNKNGNIKTHTYDSPYPKFRKVQKIEEQNETSFDEIKINRFKNHLTCYLTKINYISDNKLALGYPLMLKKTKGGILEINPIPELLSYEGYVTELQANPQKLNNFENHNFKTASGEYYNYWLPIYINEQHFELNKLLIFNSISVCKYGIVGVAINDFEPLIVLEVLPALLNKMIIFLLKGKTHLSLSAMEAYCHYIMLFVRLTEEFPIIKKIIEKKIVCGFDNLSKQKVPDIGNLIVLMLFCNMDSNLNKENVFPLLEEFFTRQIFWTFENKMTNIKDAIFQYFLQDRNLKVAFLLQKYAQVHDKEKSYNYDFLYDHKSYIDKYKQKLNGHVTFKNSLIGEFKAFLTKTNFVSLMGACTHENKSKMFEQIYKQNKGNELFLYTYKAAQKFINKDNIKFLRENYCVPSEGDLEDFVKNLNELKNSINNHVDLTKEIGYETFFPDGKDIFPSYLRFIYNSNKRGYTNIPITEMLINRFID